MIRILGRKYLFRMMVILFTLALAIDMIPVVAVQALCLGVVPATSTRNFYSGVWWSDVELARSDQSYSV